jgi:hypothetical protein
MVCLDSQTMSVELNFGEQLEDPWIYMPTKNLCILEQQFV